MVHAVSATYLRFEHMSPPAAGMALLLHVSVALALFLISPLKFTETEPTAAPIEITMENPNQPAAEPPAPPPAPPPAQQATPAQPSVPPPPAPAATRGAGSSRPLGVPPPEPKTADKPSQEPPKPPEKAEASKETATPPKPAEPLKEEATTPNPPDPQQAAAAPPEAALDAAGKNLPQVTTPSAPLSMQDFVKIAPPPAPHEVARTMPPAPAAPPPPQQRPQLQHSPLSAMQQNDAPQTATAPNNSFVNPAQNYSRSRVMDEYTWQVIRKFSQYLPNLRDKNEGGTVTLRFTIARDGRLLDAAIANSSGVQALDKGMLDALRAASPYPPLPAEFAGDRATFTQPITAKR